MIEDLLIPLKLLSVWNILHIMRNSQADLQAVGAFQDKSMKLGTNVVLYLSYKFITRTNLSDPILTAILHHIQQCLYEILKDEIQLIFKICTIDTNLVLNDRTWLLKNYNSVTFL